MKVPGSCLWMLFAGVACAEPPARLAVPTPFDEGGVAPAAEAKTAPTPGIRIEPHTEVECLPGETVIWTAAMQAAFDRVVGSKGTKVFEKVTPPNAVIKAMAKFKWDEDAVMPAGGWFAMAGEATPELAAAATAKWRELAGAGEKPFNPPKKGPLPGYAAYVGIKRDFLFKTEFYPSKGTKMEWGTGKVAVKFFGVAGEQVPLFADAVKVLAYRPSEKVQALEFLAKEGDDRMVLYTPKDGQTIEEAIGWLRTWRAGWEERSNVPLGWNDKYIHEKDDLRVPEISVEREEEMTGKFDGILRFKDDPIDWMITDAKTSAKLTVDAAGVKFKAKASMEMVPFGGVLPKPPRIVPRQFWFDRPFFLFLWREKADRPYAGVWFGEPVGLVK